MSPHTTAAISLFFCLMVMHLPGLFMVTADPAPSALRPVTQESSSLFETSQMDKNTPPGENSPDDPVSALVAHLTDLLRSHSGIPAQEGTGFLSPGRAQGIPGSDIDIGRLIREKSGKVVILKDREVALKKPESSPDMPLTNPLAGSPSGSGQYPLAEKAPENPAYISWSSSKVTETVAPRKDPSSHETTLGHVPEPVLFPSPDLQAQAGTKKVETVFPQKFDLRARGKLTPVKNQNPCGSCWAHSALASLESTLLTREFWDFSENNMKNTHGFNWLSCEGGNRIMASAYLTRWSGPVDEPADPYNGDPLLGANSPPGLQAMKHIQEILYIPDKTGPSSADETKKALMEYGAVHSSMYWDPSFFSKGTSSYYYQGSNYANHDVTIVGWDDTYSRTAFFPSPPGDGAWIVKNSWGQEWGDQGYCYISYYDTRIDLENAVYLAEPVKNFDTIYQYDPLGLTDLIGFGSPTAMMTNIFLAKENQEISAVGFYTVGQDTKYELAVFSGTNPEPSATRKGTIPMAGYHTLRLDSPVAVSGGESFTVSVKLTTPGTTYPLAAENPMKHSSHATANPGESYISPDGKVWADITRQFPDANVCLKAYGKSAVTVGSAADLTLSSFEAPVSAVPGGQIAVSVVVKNLGSTDAPESALVFSLLPTGSQALGDEIPLGSVTVQPVRKGGSLAVSTSFKVPASLQGQKYYVVATINPDGAVPEKNRQNNQISSEVPLLVGSGTADLTIRSLKGPASMASGSVTEVSFIVANTGSVPSKTTDMTFFLSTANPTGPDDITVLGSASVPSLSGNGAYYGLYRVTIPEKLPEGAYYLGGYVDLSEQNTESDEDDNIGMYPIKIRVYQGQSLPDLAFVEVSAPATVPAGSTLSINDTVQNVGFTTSGQSYAGFGLVSDTDDEIVFLGMRIVPPLGPGWSSSAKTTLTVPLSTPKGNYTLASVLYSPDSQDPNTENDYAFVDHPVTVTEKVKGGSPDIAVIAVNGPDRASAGEMVTMSATVQNVGTGTSGGFVVGYYLTEDRELTPDDILVGSFYTPSLAPGASISGNGPIRLPATLVQGTYYLGAIADPKDSVREPEDSNNVMLSGKAILISNPALQKNSTPVSTPVKTPSILKKISRR